MSSRRAKRAWIGVALFGALVGAWFAWRSLARAPLSPPPMSVLRALGPSSDDDRFARALAPREFRFPDDHGPHPAFRNEWWYWTGNLVGEAGRRFGYQLTIFRSALTPEPTRDRQSAWAARQIYMAHFALSDAAATKFYAFERTSRQAIGLAGAEVSPFRVWVLDWSASAAGSRVFPLRLRAESGGVAIDLELDEGKPIVLQGDQGLSRKGTLPGNASYYYSLTRIPTRGTVSTGGARFEVRGDSWMDREWSTSALEPEQAGWDWLALQLDDGRDIMVFRLRRRDGATDLMSAGSIVERDGTVQHLSATDFDIRTLQTWRSPHSAADYPTSVRLLVPAASLDARISPLLADQELNVSFRYWEGAVYLEGRAGDHSIAGRGYLELTGYGERNLGAR